MSNRDTDTIDAITESARLRKLVGELQRNLCNISDINESDLETLSNMDPNSLVDIAGRELLEQVKDTGRLGGEILIWWFSPTFHLYFDILT